MISVGFNTLKLKIHEIFLAFWNAIETIELPYNAVIYIKHNVGIYVSVYIKREIHRDSYTQFIVYCIKFFFFFFFTSKSYRVQIDIVSITPKRI